MGPASPPAPENRGLTERIEVGLRERHAIGVKRIMWSSDYPHSETTWPDSRKLIAEAFNVTRATNLNFGPDAVSPYGTAAQPVATAGQPLFAPSTARFGGPRQVQLGMRVVF